MYGAAIPEDAEAMLSKRPKYQAPTRRGYGLVGLVVALCVGVMIGASGTMLLTGGPEAPSPSRAAMELDAQSHGCNADAIKYFQDHPRIVAFQVCSERCGDSNACLSLFPN